MEATMEQEERQGFSEVWEEVREGVRALDGLYVLFGRAGEEDVLTPLAWEKAFTALDVVRQFIDERLDRLHELRREETKAQQVAA